jgi:hypothetical protein
MKDRNIAMLYCSRNNYHVLEEIFYKKSFKGVDDIYTINIDCGSTNEQKKEGKEILKKHNVNNLILPNSDNTIISMGKCVEEAFNYLDRENLKQEWLMVVQQDVYLPQDNFWDLLEKEIDRKDFLDKVGSIGFAVRDTPQMGDICYGRGNLMEGMIGKREGFLNDLPESYLKADYFVVECCWYVAWLINRNLFRKYIKPDLDLIINLWGDDISTQFMINNVANITIPKFLIVDDFRGKTNLGILPCNQGYNKFFHGDHWNHHYFWDKKYGYKIFYANKNYSIAEQERINTFDTCRMKYMDTIIEKMFYSHVDDGPKILKDVGL